MFKIRWTDKISVISFVCFFFLCREKRNSVSMIGLISMWSEPFTGIGLLHRPIGRWIYAFHVKQFAFLHCLNINSSLDFLEQEKKHIKSKIVIHKYKSSANLSVQQIRNVPVHFCFLFVLLFYNLIYSFKSANICEPKDSVFFLGVSFGCNSSYYIRAIVIT